MTPRRSSPAVTRNLPPKASPVRLPGRSPLETVAATAGELRAAELEMAKARARFEYAVRRASASGLSQQQIADAAGLSRQRMGQILARVAR